MKNRLKVAVIGTGNIGAVAAANLVKSGRHIIVAGKNFRQAEKLALKLGDNVTPMETVEAIKAADIIILAVWFNTIKELLKIHHSELKGKIIVDPSNPIAPDEKGGFKKIIGDKESAGELLSALIPEGSKYVKAFGSLGAGSLLDAAFKQLEKAVLFYATDDDTANSTIDELIGDAGFHPVKIGGVDQSIRMEVFGDLHEFGALGKPVTKAEAEQHLNAAA